MNEVTKLAKEFVQKHFSLISLENLDIKDFTKSRLLKEIEEDYSTACWVLTEVMSWGMKDDNNYIKQYQVENEDGIPKTFKLQNQHVRFFYNKILYLSKRSDELYQELIRRKYDVEDYSDCYRDIPPHLFNDWQETKEARELLKERINHRLKESKQVIRFYDKVVTLEEALIK